MKRSVTTCLVSKQPSLIVNMTDDESNSIRFQIDFTFTRKSSRFRIFVYNERRFILNGPIEPMALYRF